MHGLPHFILLLRHVMFTYHCYTCMSRFHIPVTHACMVSLVLSYGSPFLLHVSCYMIVSRYWYVWFLYSLHMDPRSYYMYHVIWLFPVTDIVFPLLDTWAVDMRYVESHIYCSRFPLSCLVLSTELMSCYRVTCTISCTCSWYTV